MRHARSAHRHGRGSAPPPHRHAFPTRRSSDLDAAGLERLRAAVEAVRVEPQITAYITAVVRGTREAASRSEEHTSELQSHHDLVCRLLLEKKNPGPTSMTCSGSVSP